MPTLPLNSCVTLDRLLTSLGLGFLIYEMGEITMLHEIIEYFD